jgi:hypothetical protein
VTLSVRKGQVLRRPPAEPKTHRRHDTRAVPGDMTAAAIDAAIEANLAAIRAQRQLDHEDAWRKKPE